MCYRERPLRLEPPPTASDVGHALGSFGFILAIIVAVSMFAATVLERPSPEAREIIQAGRVMVGEMGR